MTTKGEPADIRLVIRDLVNLATGALLAYSVFDPSLLIRTPVAATAILVALAHSSRLTRADLAFAALTALTWASSTWTQAPEATKIAAVTQTGCLAAFLLVRATATHPRALRLACIGYLVGCITATWQMADKAGGLSAAALTGGTRADLTGLNQNYLAYALAGGLVVCVILRRARPGAGGRLLLWGAAATIIAGILIADTRAAMVSVALLAGWLLLHRVIRTRRGIGFVLAAVVAGGVAIATGAINGLVARFVPASERDTGTLNGRLPLWEQAVDVFREHPTFGAGGGAFRELNTFGMVAHNGFLEIATGLGVAGLALLAYTLYQTLVVETRLIAPETRAALVGAFIVVQAPAFLSGHWVQAPALWATVAILTRLPTAIDLDARNRPRSEERGRYTHTRTTPSGQTTPRRPTPAAQPRP